MWVFFSSPESPHWPLPFTSAVPATTLRILGEGGLGGPGPTSQWVVGKSYGASLYSAVYLPELIVIDSREQLS